MARIPEEEIERIKREVAIVPLVESRGVKLSGHGNNLMGLCPFHDDKSPSLVVSPSKNVWHCLGACQAGGSVIDWLMKADRVSFRLAVEMLRKKAPSLAAPKPATRARLDELAEPHDPDRIVLRRVVDFYHETLKQSVEALAYLRVAGSTRARCSRPFDSDIQIARSPIGCRSKRSRPAKRSARNCSESGSCAAAGTNISRARS